MKRFGFGAFGQSAFLFFTLLLVAGRAEGMTIGELVRALTKVNAEEVATVSGHPASIKESRPDFLGGSAVYLEVEVLLPTRPLLFRYIHDTRKGLYRLSPGATQLDRVRAEGMIAIKDAEMALRFAQWRLALTEGGYGFWLVSSVEQVPFLPQRKDEPDRTERLNKAKAAVAGKIVPAAAKADQDGFTVTQIAVWRRDLVRYEAQVGPDGAWSHRKEVLIPDLPVVEVIH